MHRPSDPPGDATGTEVPVVGANAGPRPRPGLVVVWDGGEATCRPVAIDGRELAVGRAVDGDVVLRDRDVSRKHAWVGVERGRLFVEDAGSKFGTHVHGRQEAGRTYLADGAVMRLGGALLVARDDVRPFEAAPVRVDGAYVVGPALAAAFEAATLAGMTGRWLLVGGETGSGKERVARRWHAASRRASGPFVAVNCAELDPETARADLFGAKKGAYSGCDADRDGVFVEADGGTLFLDEIGELDVDVQSKLLRVLETGLVRPMGGTRTRKVDVAIVAATHRDLGARIAQGKFRKDVLTRLARSRVEVPPLRTRREEIPWLVALAVQDAWDGLAATPAWDELGRAPKPTHVSLVEACLARAWGGNVRELLDEAGDAVLAAVLVKADAVRAEHLRAEEFAAAAATETAVRGGRRAKEADERAALLAAMARNGGSLPKAALECGISRSKAYRLMGRSERAS